MYFSMSGIWSDKQNDSVQFGAVIMRDFKEEITLLCPLLLIFQMGSKLKT